MANGTLLAAQGCQHRQAHASRGALEYNVDLSYKRGPTRTAGIGKISVCMSFGEPSVRVFS